MFTHLLLCQCQTSSLDSRPLSFPLLIRHHFWDCDPTRYEYSLYRATDIFGMNFSRVCPPPVTLSLPLPTPRVIC